MSRVGEDLLDSGRSGGDVVLVNVVKVRPRGDREGRGANDRGDGRQGWRWKRTLRHNS